MKDGIATIRREITRLKHDRRPTAVRYPVSLQRKVVAIARRRRTRGAGIATIARELGLAEWTLNLWLRKKSGRMLRVVEIIPSAAPAMTTATPPVLITPQGIRIEGASVDALAALLRAVL